MTVTKWVSTVVLTGLLCLSGCGRRVVRVDLIPVEDRLQPQEVERDAGMFVSDQIVMIDVSGLIANMNKSSAFGSGENPVSDFRETLNAVERNGNVKAVVLRINSPGGTVTASDIMYRDLKAFKERTGIPVVVCMMDLCASGGYYLSCAADYRIAHPSTITGSIGVIVQHFSIAGTLSKIGVTATAVTSGPNKDMLSPFKPTDQKDLKLAQDLVNEFYGQFKDVVRNSHQKIKDDDWAAATDGRVFTGKQAAAIGLVDEVGDLDTALAKARELGHISKARLIMYSRTGEVKGSIYAASGIPQIKLDPAILADAAHPMFLYMWMGQ